MRRLVGFITGAPKGQPSPEVARHPLAQSPGWRLLAEGSEILVTQLSKVISPEDVRTQLLAVADAVYYNPHNIAEALEGFDETIRNLVKSVVEAPYQSLIAEAQSPQTISAPELPKLRISAAIMSLLDDWDESCLAAWGAVPDSVLLNHADQFLRTNSNEMLKLVLCECCFYVLTRRRERHACDLKCIQYINQTLSATPPSGDTAHAAFNQEDFNHIAEAFNVAPRDCGGSEKDRKEFMKILYLSVERRSRAMDSQNTVHAHRWKKLAQQAQWVGQKAYAQAQEKADVFRLYEEKYREKKDALESEWQTLFQIADEWTQNQDHIHNVRPHTKRMSDFYMRLQSICAANHARVEMAMTLVEQAELETISLIQSMQKAKTNAIQLCRMEVLIENLHLYMQSTQKGLNDLRWISNGKDLIWTGCGLLIFSVAFSAASKAGGHMLGPIASIGSMLGVGKVMSYLVGAVTIAGLGSLAVGWAMTNQRAFRLWKDGIMTRAQTTASALSGYCYDCYCAPAISAIQSGVAAAADVAAKTAAWCADWGYYLGQQSVNYGGTTLATIAAHADASACAGSIPASLFNAAITMGSVFNTIRKLVINPGAAPTTVEADVSPPETPKPADSRPLGHFTKKGGKLSTPGCAILFSMKVDGKNPIHEAMIKTSSRRFNSVEEPTYSPTGSATAFPLSPTSSSRVFPPIPTVSTTAFPLSPASGALRCPSSASASAHVFANDEFVLVDEDLGTEEEFEAALLNPMDRTLEYHLTNPPFIKYLLARSFKANTPIPDARMAFLSESKNKKTLYATYVSCINRLSNKIIQLEYLQAALEGNEPNTLSTIFAQKTRVAQFFTFRNRPTNTILELQKWFIQICETLGFQQDDIKCALALMQPLQPLS